MATFKYIVNQIDTNSISDVKNIDSKDSTLIGNFEISSTYDQSIHNIELHFYAFDGTLLKSIPNFKNISQLGNAAGAGKKGASNLILNPTNDAVSNGFENGDVKLLYRFTNNLYSSSNKQPKFFIESISADRTEVRALSNQLTDEQVSNSTIELKNKLNSTSYFSEYFLNFGDGKTFIGLNIDTEVISKGRSVVLKLYQPLDSTYTVNNTFTIEEEVSNEVLFEVQAEVISDQLKIPYLKGPNFAVEVTDENSNPTEYLNYNELFSYPVTSSYYELRSLFNDKSAQIAINHSDYSDFIHFSSAEERLRNFKYKLDLIHSYQSSIDSINSTGYIRTGITGSLDYYKNLIEGIVNNFDHYDRYLYYESGSTSWPKGNTTRPYITQLSNTSEATTWYTNQLVSASNYDVTNFDILTNTIPTFIREDSNNDPYLMFIHMIGQHFDNLWIYFKAVSDKYDADNRLNFGISKDIVRSTIESFGIKLYDSNQNLDNLFSLLTGENYISGSEVISSVITATSGSGSEYLQPVPKDNYLKEIYKRIYHNLPLLLKSKGTERGLRALLNSFGIPRDILSVKIFGGVKSDTNLFYGPNYYVTSSFEKIRTDNTGSITSGSTLSRYTSISKPQVKYSDDSHTVEIGFNLSEQRDSYVKNSLSSSKFSIDDYIGDPRDMSATEYRLLDILDENTVDSSISRNPSGFVRLVKFFDNSIFRIVKDFIPARTNANVGIVVKPTILNRSKTKTPTVSWIRPEYIGSIDTAFITGSHGESFGSEKKVRYNTNYSASYKTPLGVITRDITDQSPRYTGEFSGSATVVSTMELNAPNIFKTVNQPLLQFDVTIFNLSLPIPPACNITLVSTYLGEYYVFYGESNQGTVEVTYPTSEAATDTSITYVNNHNIYEYVTVEAAAQYGYTFDGWYTEASGGGSLISTGSILTLTYPYQRASGSNYYANFV